MAEKHQFQQQAQTFGNAMNSIAYGEVIKAAVRDYAKEAMDKEGAVNQEQHQQMDMEELMGDEELQKLHADRIEQLKAEREKRANMKVRGHGSYVEITEADFLETVTKTELVIVHFMHREFERCKIMDKHLQTLAFKYFTTRVVKISAPDSPFFSLKLNVKMLPCIIGFKNGVAVDRITGFESLGGRDDFDASLLEDQLLAMGVLKYVAPDRDEEQDRLDGPGKSVRKGFASIQRTQSDEDSDFD